MLDDHSHIADDELIAAVASELTAHQQAVVARHLATCLVCTARRDTLRQTSNAVKAAIQQESDAASLAQVRAHLRVALRHEANRRRWAPLESLGSLGSLWSLRSLTVAVVGLAAILVALAWLQPAAESPALADAWARPLAEITPGATVVTRADALCGAEPAAEWPIPSPIRDQVIASYGMQGVPAEDYELDYLITPELGGALDARNLWPQRYSAGPWNALVKDELERLLPHLVCSGRLDLTTAQRDMAADWIAAYRKYFRTSEPLRTHVRVGREFDLHARLSPVLDILPPKS